MLAFKFNIIGTITGMWLITIFAILCFPGQLSMQWQYKQAVALKCIIQFRYDLTEAFSLL